MVSTTENAAAAPVGAGVGRLVDHLSRIAGLAVANFYLIAAACTLWEVFTRYILHSPTQWVFEVVMVLCASAWMLSAGFVTLQKRHIGITVFYLRASEGTKWWLDLFAMLVGVFALYMLASDVLLRALEKIDIMERSGTAWNSPQPVVLFSVLAAGLFLYLLQLLFNLSRHFRSRPLQVATLAVLVLIIARVLLSVAAHYGGYDSTAMSINEGLNDAGGALVEQINMDADEIGIGTVSLAIVIVLLLLMMTGMPLGIVTLIISVICALIFYGNPGMLLVSTNAMDLLEKYPLVAVPFFVLMASILERSGIARDLFDAMSIFAGGFRGGVALQTTIVAVILAAMSGVMGGEIVMLGLVALPQMLRLGYDRKLTIGLICAAGALATLIPPSIVMIVYGLSANVGIGDLFSAGFIPGLMLAAFYVAFVLVRVNLSPRLAPTAREIAQLTGTETRLGTHQLVAVFLCILLIASVMGFIYGGITSVTEASAVGVFGAIIVALVRLKFSFRLLRECLASTMAIVGTIIWLILGAVAFVGLYNLIGGADFMRSLISGTGLGAIGTIFLMMAILVVLGTFMEWIAIIFITVPIFAPVVVGLTPELAADFGMAVCSADLKTGCLNEYWVAVWFGVLFVMNIQIYFLSPPFGPACFWLKSVVPAARDMPDGREITLQEIFLSVLPFIVLQIIGMLLVMFFPFIALWMPQALGS